jgi:predicted dehydrogenase
MTETNWGIIGPGNIAHDFARDLRLVPVMQRVTAVLSHREDSANEFAREFNVPGIYTDFNAFVENKNIDAVYIATPHPHHFEQALFCLTKNIPVLCEKPMTLNANESQKLVAAAQKHKTFLMEGMWIRFLPSIQQVLSIINDGRIGNVLSVKASICYKAPDDSKSRYFDPSLGGGSLLDLGIYPIFLACLLMGKPDTVKAVGTLTADGIDKACSILFHYKTGQQASLESSLLAQSDLPAEITGEKGTIKILDPWYEKSKGIELHVYDDGKIIYPSRWDGHGLQFEVQEVLNCIQQNKIESDSLSHAFSLEMIQVMDEIRSQIRVTYDMYE